MEDSPHEELSTPLLQPASTGEDDDDPESPADGNDALAPNANNDTIANHESITYGKNGDAYPPNASGSNIAHVDYESHFTLRIPTSTVHFRGSILRVIDTDQDQIILQQRTDGDDGGEQEKVLVKRLSPGTYAQRFLRVGYTLITILFLGFLFVFCFQVLLFLFIALPVDSGYTSGSPKVDGMAIVSTLLSFPVMMYGMSSLMSEYVAAFCLETTLGVSTLNASDSDVYHIPIFHYSHGISLCG